MGTTDSGLMHPTRVSIANYVVNAPMAITPAEAVRSSSAERLELMVASGAEPVSRLLPPAQQTKAGLIGLIGNGERCFQFPNERPQVAKVDRCKLQPVAWCVKQRSRRDVFRRLSLQKLCIANCRTMTPLQIVPRPKHRELHRAAHKFAPTWGATPLGNGSFEYSAQPAFLEE